MKLASLKATLAGSASALFLATGVHAAEFNIPGGDLKTALHAYAEQARVQLIVADEAIKGARTKGVQGDLTADAALTRILRGTGFTTQRTPSGAIGVVHDRGAPAGEVEIAQAESRSIVAAGIESVLVTAQKKTEDIQLVPIAITALSQEQLQEMKIEGGPDLLKTIPNVTFSKNNFTGYNFSIRGIGTKAISVTTDPGVAVSFNSTTLIRNRLFEQEYFDVERVEILRGPQGTLYGRNATSGVINVISAKPDLDSFSGMIKGEVGNYNAKRLSGMVNVPLIDDMLAIRIAAATTVRNGYGVDLFDNSHVDGRDLWSVRTTVAFKPAENFRADLVWERFHENDDRARTSKQLCTRDPGPDQVGGVALPGIDEEDGHLDRGGLSQGCLPGSLYNDHAYETPNGTSLPFVLYLQTLSLGRNFANPAGCEGGGFRCPIIALDSDPYGTTTQSHDLRAIYSQIKPVYRADADVLELNASWDIGGGLTAVSQTAYDKDKIYSTQDFNRYTTLPTFIDTSGLTASTGSLGGPSKFAGLAPNGVFCDPQLGCSNTIVGMDLSRAHSMQFSQEIRVQSDWSGAFNFSGGLTFTRYRTVEDYYVFFNALTIASLLLNSTGAVVGGLDPSKTTLMPDCSALNSHGVPDGLFCVPIETNPIGSIQDTGHNYYRSRNPYLLKSLGAFGEGYWTVSDALKLTAGLRYTDDRKTFTPIPSELLLTDPARLPAIAVVNPGLIDYWKGLPFFSFASGTYPAQPDIVLGWGEFTGRVGFDWKPQTPITDQTMIYSFYSRGYKGGGMNPPRVGLDYAAIAAGGIVLTPSAPADFRPEFVNAYEVGAKNTLLGGAMVLNADTFYYDYKDYQVSKIVDRTANNENFDAKIWGLEIETVFQPIHNLRFNGSFGYLNTRLADGSRSIDVMNRTAGHSDWVVVRPAITLTSNCIAPVAIVAKALEWASGFPSTGATSALCPGGAVSGVSFNGKPPAYLTFLDGSTYDPADYPESNYGAGFYTDVSGHDLPNSPHFTATMGVQYSMDIVENWTTTIRGDGYWQSQSWARVYDLPVDKLHGWYNANLSLWVERPDDGLKIEIYAKNLLDKSPITDTFTNADDADLTTNVFVLDPRLIGVSITKQF